MLDTILGQDHRVAVAAGTAGTISAAPGTKLTLAGDLSLYGDVTFGSTGQTGTITVALQSGSVGANASIVVAAGTLRASHAGPTTLSLFTNVARSTTVAAGAALALNAANLFVKNLRGAGSVVLAGTATTTLTVQGGDFAGVVSGPGRLTKTGAGTLSLAGPTPTRGL